MAKISLVIPCHNEEKTIGRVIERSLPNVDEIIVVDNNCTDRTASIARSYPKVKVVKEMTPGYGAAIKAGLNSASHEILVVLDGDDQYPSEDIPSFIEELDKNKLDFISASRFPLKNKKSISRLRRVGNRSLTLAANILFGLDLRDSQSGMWVFRKKVLSLVKPMSDDMPFSEEIKIKTIRSGFNFKEIGIDYRSRLGDSKLMPLSHGYKNLKFLFELRTRPRKTHKFN